MGLEAQSNHGGTYNACAVTEGKHGLCRVPGPALVRLDDTAGDARRDQLQGINEGRGVDPSAGVEDHVSDLDHAMPDRVVDGQRAFLAWVDPDDKRFIHGEASSILAPPGHRSSKAARRRRDP